MSSTPPGGDRRDARRIDRRSKPALKGHLELLAGDGVPKLVHRVQGALAGAVAMFYEPVHA